MAIKRTRLKAVRDCLAKGQCVLPECDRPLDRRGLCSQHYGQFYYALKRKGSAEERDAFEQEMIRQGLVLDPYQQRTGRNLSPFSKDQEFR